MFSEEEKLDSRSISYNSRGGLIPVDEKALPLDGIDTYRIRFSSPLSDRFESANKTNNRTVNLDGDTPKKTLETSKDYRIAIHQEGLQDMNESVGEFKIMLSSGDQLQTVSIFFNWERLEI